MKDGMVAIHSRSNHSFVADADAAVEAFLDDHKEVEVHTIYWPDTAGGKGTWHLDTFHLVVVEEEWAVVDMGRDKRVALVAVEKSLIVSR